MTESVGQYIIKTPESLKSKEKISDEEMGNLLSAVGNHEAKAITLVLMRNGAVYNRGNLHREFLNAQGENKGWRIGDGVPFDYCSKSLDPIGLVAKEILNLDLSTYGYAITKNGKELGIPLAGLLLDFSERHNISLNQLLGATISSSEDKTIQTEKGNIEFRKRSPSTTLKILYQLATSPNLPIREADFVKGMGEADRIVFTHLTRLSKFGLVQYNAIKANESRTWYKFSAVIPEGKLPIYANYRTLTKSVFDTLKHHPDQYLTSEDICNLLPREQKENWKNEKIMRENISAVSFFLAKHKYASIEKFYYKKQSEVNITDGQKIVLTEFLEIMYRFQNLDKEILETGRRVAEEIISNPQRVSNLLRRAKEASSNVNRSSLEETQGYMLSIISSNPDGVTNKEIQKILEEKYGKKLGAGRINKLSFSLIKNEAIRVEKKGAVSILYPSNKTEI